MKEIKNIASMLGCGEVTKREVLQYNGIFALIGAAAIVAETYPFVSVLLALGAGALLWIAKKS